MGLVARAVALFMAVLPLTFGTLPAQAHPHVWVTTETTVLYDNGTFVGLRHKWTFDDLHSAMAVEGLDKNGDGKYDRDELAELAKADIEGLQESNYFTVSALAGEQLKFGAARDYWYEHIDGILSLHFTLPFERPVLADAKGFTFSISDPEFFIAFEFAKDDPVKFSDGAPGTCKASIRQQEADQALSESLQRQFGAFAVTTTTMAVIDCGLP
jgi:ABC-type uncharacterized transport system substrate-binding protein